MYKIINAAIWVFWVLDITNMPFMEIFDTTYPINSLAWLLIFLVLPTTKTQTEIKVKYDEDKEE